MKKYLHYTLIFLIVNWANPLIAQKSDPFDAKKKSTFVKGAFPRPPLTSLPGNVSFSYNGAAFPYHSIPFMLTGNGQKQNYHNLKFNRFGRLIFLEGYNSKDRVYDMHNPESVRQAAFGYLNNIKNMIGIKNPEEEFNILEAHNDDYGFTHVKFQQYYNGIKVYNGQLFVHGKEGKMQKFNGEYFSTPNIENITPAVSADEAFTTVKQDLNVPFTEPSQKSFLTYTPIEYELVIYHTKKISGIPRLTWHLTVRPDLFSRYEYFVDALTGNILNSFDNTCSDGPATASATDLNGVSQTINTYQLNGNYYLIDASRPMFKPGSSQLPDNGVGVIWTINAQNSPANQNLQVYQFISSNNSWSQNPEAVSAHYNAGTTYEYYRTTHGRNSINGNGGTIISICNISNADGSSMENAFWNGTAMFYGNGGNVFKPLAGALDVGAHEMGHGVIQNTCNLEYQDESGALNESMADISGTMVDRDDWFLGEDVVKNTNYYPTGHLRDMSNPHNGGSSLNDACYQPAHLSEKYTGSQDNGGVHINSGIMNFAYYKFASVIGKDKSEKIWYKAMTDYLVKQSQFADARIAFVNAASDIFGANSDETQAVKNAFTAVGINDAGGGSGGGSGPGQNDLQVNPGQDYIMVTNPDEYYNNTIFIATTDGNSQTPVSSTILAQKPSIVDDGSIAVMVTTNNKVKYLDLNNGEEGFLSDENVFQNISISKDGKRIAVISTFSDSAIWVYDFGVNQWNKFHLYNPTFTPDVVTNNVLYADAVEWDYSGQYIIYDALNRIKNASGEDIDYWDMGIIKVWDNNNNNWSDGKIEKIFADLPEGVSVGNPSLSKNSPYIMTFDYYDETNNDIAVLAANLATGDVGVIFENSVLGYPNYSKLDDKIIFNATDNLDNKVIGKIAVNSDKISPAGDPSILLDNRKWGVWFATGVRDLNDVEENVSSDFTLFPNPVKNNLNVLLTEKAKNASEIIVYNMFGQAVITKPLKRGEILINMDLSSLPAGTYLVKFTGTEGKKIVKF